MVELIKNPATRQTLRTMLGNMYPSEIADMTEDRQIRKTNIPLWIEEILTKECSYVVARLPRYEEKIRQKYGHVDTLVDKLRVYHTVRDNWDSLEPCNFISMMPLRYYFDEHIDNTVKRRIDRTCSQT